jgi:hypothetical protein
MKGTLISIFVGAVAGVLLTVGSNVHASHVAANHAKQAGEVAAPEQVAPEAVSDPAVPAAPSSDQAPLLK